MAQLDLLSRCVRLLRKEHVSRFYFGHSIRVLYDFLMMEPFAADRLRDLEDPRGRALEADDCVPGLHFTLKSIELFAALHA